MRTTQRVSHFYLSISTVEINPTTASVSADPSLFNHVIVNEELDKAYDEFLAAIDDELKQFSSNRETNNHNGNNGSSNNHHS